MNLRLNRLTEALTFSLFKSFTFISLLFPFLKHFLSKTLDLFSMDAMFFDYDDVFDRPLSRPYERLSDIDHADQLYLVHYRYDFNFSTLFLFLCRNSLTPISWSWNSGVLQNRHALLVGLFSGGGMRRESHCFRVMLPAFCMLPVRRCLRRVMVGTAMNWTLKLLWIWEEMRQNLRKKVAQFQ